MTLDGCDWLASGPGRIPWERRGTLCVEGLVSEGAGRGVLEEGKAIACTEHVRNRTVGRHWVFAFLLGVGCNEYKNFFLKHTINFNVSPTHNLLYNTIISLGYMFRLLSVIIRPY